MAILNLNIPQDKVVRFLASVSYQATIKDAQGNDIPNPVTALVYSKNWILEVVKQQILRYEANVASATATDTALKQDLSDVN